MNRTEELINWDKTHLFHGVTPAGENLGKVFERGDGVKRYDSNGKEYLDCSSQLVCVNLGYSQNEIIDAAMEHATYEILPDDGSYYGEVPLCPGVHANANTLEACRKELEETLEDWLLLRVHKQLPIPEVDGLRLEVNTEQVA